MWLLISGFLDCESVDFFQHFFSGKLRKNPKIHSETNSHQSMEHQNQEVLLGPSTTLQFTTTLASMVQHSVSVLELSIHELNSANRNTGIDWIATISKVKS